MKKTLDSARRSGYRRAMVGLGVFGLALVSGCGLDRLRLGSARLISIEELPESGDACARPVASASTRSLFSAFEQPSVYAQTSGGTIDVNRPPVRDILDTAPIYSSVAVDTEHNEVLLQDANTWSIKVFSRLDNAKPADPPPEPRPVIGGPPTGLPFNSCVWVDPASGDIYSVENDIGDVIVVFPHDATGNAP